MRTFDGKNSTKYNNIMELNGTKKRVCTHKIVTEISRKFLDFFIASDKGVTKYNGFKKIKRGNK